MTRSHFHFILVFFSSFKFDDHIVQLQNIDIREILRHIGYHLDTDVGEGVLRIKDSLQGSWIKLLTIVPETDDDHIGFQNDTAVYEMLLPVMKSVICNDRSHFLDTQTRIQRLFLRDPMLTAERNGVF